MKSEIVDSLCSFVAGVVASVVVCAVHYTCRMHPPLYSQFAISDVGAQRGLFALL